MDNLGAMHHMALVPHQRLDFLANEDLDEDEELALEDNDLKFFDGNDKPFARQR